MAVLAWRLGLGWLIGRRYLLLTTSQRRTAIRFRFFAGTFYVRRVDAAWAHDLDRSPAATIQAWPGPRSVRARHIAGADERALAKRLWGDSPVMALSPTGQRTPDMTAPDLVWLWPLALGVAWLARRRI